MEHMFQECGFWQSYCFLPSTQRWEQRWKQRNQVGGSCIKLASDDDDGSSLDQGHCSGSGERWSDNEYIVKVEPKCFVSGSFVRYERKKGIRGKSNFLFYFLPELIRGWSFHSLNWHLVIWIWGSGIDAGLRYKFKKDSEYIVIKTIYWMQCPKEWL